MLKKVSEFISRSWDGTRPLLLGFSGGPDSRALLHALIESGVLLHVAHVDHGWREESRREADALREEVEGLGLFFHTIRLEAPVGGNKEEAGREARLGFFRSLFAKVPFQALILGHQADDLAETVLKRALEGAHLPSLGGMRQVSEMGEMTIWRPMLKVRRSEVLSFVKERGLKVLIDPTNGDTAFTRARMRVEILPELSRQFGKEVETSLVYLGERSSELRDYLDRKVDGIAVFKGPWGEYFEALALEKIEARHLLLRRAKEGAVFLSREMVESILDAAFAGKSDCHFGARVVVDRGLIFLLEEKMPVWDLAPMPLEVGEFLLGDWRVNVSKAEGAIAPSDWKEVWSGRFCACGPRGELERPRAGGAVRDLWTERKVPAFLRGLAPVIYDRSGGFKEFLSGKSILEKGAVFQVSFVHVAYNKPHQ